MKTRLMIVVGLIALLLGVAGGAAPAAAGGRGHGHSHGRYFHGPRVFFGPPVFVGPRVWVGSPYYYGYPYYYRYATPPVVVTPPPTTYIERPAESYWYYCQDPAGYYPQVAQCPGGWIQVPPRSE